MSATWRAAQKANRRATLLREAARLFADRGFAAVSTTELGDAVGMSGPALYNYFPSKDALLAELLVDASTRLLDGCREIVARDDAAPRTLADLVAFHLDFATSDPDTIRLQDRELAQLPGDVNHEVRRLQRAYVQEWDRVYRRVHTGLDDDERQTRLLGVFGLLNSTPHSAAATGARAPDILTDMALRALTG